ncbi:MULTISPECIES: hypothetical protein [Arthrobacter]|uniref:hypothetical protein n=1 Tax=Arthrobacter TaxID=1663 RepID=UPI001404969A|nr:MULTISPECIES: hypothetical protein [Arthrobacter]MBT8161427.1 hypothetical protein [Arthrobacter sp. GN70]
MTKRIVDLGLGLLLLAIIGSVALSAVTPYLPALGLGICLAIIGGVVVAVWRILHRRRF